MTELTSWEQFGFPGIIIAGCFTGFGFVFTKLVIPLVDSLKEQLSKQAEVYSSQTSNLISVHQAEMEKLISTQKEERVEWREAFTEQNKETNEVVKNLTIAVHELNNRYRKFEPENTQG